MSDRQAKCILGACRIRDIGNKYVGTLMARGHERERSIRSIVVHTIIISAVTAGT